MIKAVIFDLDGTLCDTLNDIRTGVNAVLQRLGYKPRSRSEIHKFINNEAHARAIGRFNVHVGISDKNALVGLYTKGLCYIQCRGWVGLCWHIRLTQTKGEYIVSEYI